MGYDDDRRGISTEEAQLQAAVLKYREAWRDNSLTPEIVNDAWSAFWTERVAAAGMNPVEMPSYDGDAAKLTALQIQDRGIVLVPKVFLQEPGGMLLLGTLFPKMGISPNNTSQYTHEDYGVYVDTEMVTDAPNRRPNRETTVKDANSSYTDI